MYKIYGPSELFLLFAGSRMHKEPVDKSWIPMGWSDYKESLFPIVELGVRVSGSGFQQGKGLLRPEAYIFIWGDGGGLTSSTQANLAWTV